MKIRTANLVHVVLVLASIAGACGRAADASIRANADSAAARVADSVSRVRQDSVNRAQPGYIIDSLLPVEEEVRRFRAAIGGEPVTSLGHSSESREALVARFIHAVEKRDTADLVRMIVSPREFIDLYYLESPHTHPPYRQSPGFLWGQMELNSSKGLSRLMERRGGKPLAYGGLSCSDSVAHQGRNQLWSGCNVMVGENAGALAPQRLFGTIIARDGRYKFLSYANGY